MASTKAIELIAILRKSGFNQRDNDGNPILSSPAIACLVSKDLLKEMAYWVKDCSDTEEAADLILEVANWHLGDKGGIVYE